MGHPFFSFGFDFCLAPRPVRCGAWEVRVKSVHYNKQIGAGLYRALGVVLNAPGSSNWDRADALDELRAFRAWLATTDAGHGLTAEPESAFRARVEAGVSARMDGDAVVIRVSRRAKK
jgi:hypothetical protein